MRTHDQLIKKLLRRPGVRTEVERIERDESALLDALLQARQAAGLTQSQVAARMGTQAPAVARLERALASGRHSPSIATLRKYVKACGKRLVLRVAYAQFEGGVSMNKRPVQYAIKLIVPTSSSKRTPSIRRYI